MKRNNFGSNITAMNVNNVIGISNVIISNNGVISYNGGRVIDKDHPITVRLFFDEKEETSFQYSGGGLELSIQAQSVGNVDCTNGNVKVKGNVERDVKTSNGKVEVVGNVGGDVATSNASITIEGDILSKDPHIKTSMGSIKINNKKL